MNKKLLAVIALTLVVIVVGFVLLKDGKKEASNSPNVEEQSVEDSKTGVKLNYRSPLQSEVLDSKDKEDKFVIRLTSQNPAMLVSVRYEEGLRAVTLVTKQEVIDLILGNVEKAFPQRYSGYQKLNERKFEVAGKQAAEIIFTYKGPSGDDAKQRLVIITKDEDTAIYISAQAQNSQFDEVNSNYFDPLFSSIRFSN